MPLECVDVPVQCVDVALQFIDVLLRLVGELQRQSTTRRVSSSSTSAVFVGSFRVVLAAVLFRPLFPSKLRFFPIAPTSHPAGGRTSSAVR